MAQELLAAANGRPVTGCFMYEGPNRDASRERTLGQMIGPSMRLWEPDKNTDESSEDIQT